MTTQIEPRREELGQELREGLARVADVLLPGTGQLPSGRKVNVHLELLDRVLEADPRPLEILRVLGARAGAVDRCTLRDLETWAGGDIEDVVFAFNAAYYMAPAVLSALRYPGQTRRPVAQATPEELCSDELLEPVRQRGAIFVPTPGAPAS